MWVCFPMVVLCLFFCGKIVTAVFAEDAKKEVSAGTIIAKDTKADVQGKNVTIICPSGGKVKVNVENDPKYVKDVDVTTVCKEGSDVEVNVGSLEIEGGKQVKGDIDRRVSNANITTVSGKGVKSKVNVGSVIIGK